MSRYQHAESATMGSRNEHQSNITGNTPLPQNNHAYPSSYIHSSNTGAHVGSADASTISHQTYEQTNFSGNGMSAPQPTYSSSFGPAATSFHGLPYYAPPSQPLHASPMPQQYPSMSGRDILQNAATTEENAPVLRFDSWDAISKAYDARRRQKLVIPDDDVDDVELNKFNHVKALIVALKTTTYDDPPFTKTGLGEDRKMGVHEIDEDFRKRLITAFERANHSCSVILSEKDSDLEVEYHAWNIFNEIINFHRTGSWNHSQIKASFIKCSKRVQLAIKKITDSSSIRHKMLEAVDVSGFCLNPDGFAYVIWRKLDNNIKRQYKAERANGTVAEPVDQKVNKNLVGRGAAVEGGAASRRRRPATDLAKEERVPKKRKTKSSQDGSSGRRQGSSASIQDASQIDPALSTSPVDSIPQDADVSKSNILRSQLAPFTRSATAIQTAGVSVFPTSNAFDPANYFHGSSTSSASRNLPWLAPNGERAPNNSAHSNVFSNRVPQNSESYPHAFGGIESSSPHHLHDFNRSENHTPDAYLMHSGIHSQSPNGGFSSHNDDDPTYQQARSSSNYSAATVNYQSMRHVYPDLLDMARSGLAQNATPNASLDNLSTGQYGVPQASTGRERLRRGKKPT